MENYFKITDPQISGVEDDGSTEGIMKTKLVSGELYDLPASLMVWTTQFGQTARNRVNNTDGSLSCRNMFIASGLSQYWVARTHFYGKVLGIRVRKETTFPDFTVIVDGQPFKVNSSNLISSQTERGAVVMLPTIFEDRLHSLKILLHPSITVSKSVVIYGLVVEKQVGHKVLPRLDFISYKGKLTSGFVKMPFTDAEHGLQKVMYHNTDVSARTVTITWDSEVIFQETLQSGTHTEFCPSQSGISMGDYLDGPQFQQKADVTGVVNYFIVHKY